MGSTPLTGRTAPVERQFADHDEVVQLVGFDLFAGGQHADGDGQVEARPFLLHVGRARG